MFQFILIQFPLKSIGIFSLSSKNHHFICIGIEIGLQCNVMIAMTMLHQKSQPSLLNMKWKTTTSMNNVTVNNSAQSKGCLVEEEEIAVTTMEEMVDEDLEERTKVNVHDTIATVAIEHSPSVHEPLLLLLLSFVFLLHR